MIIDNYALQSGMFVLWKPDDDFTGVKCLPNEMQSLFHRGGDYLTGVNPACPACPVASENGTRVGPADGTGVDF